MPDWTGILTVEGTPTGDGRLIDIDALYWDEDPLPLIWDRTDGDHTGMVVGSVDKIWRDPGDGFNLIRGEGSFSVSEDEETQKAVNRVQELLDEGAVGVSVALDHEDRELRAKADLAVVAVLIGDASLPVADTSRPWSGAAARNRVFDFYTNEAGEVDVEGVSKAFLWRDPDADPQTRGAYSLGFADIINGRLTIVPRGVAATAGGRGVSALSGVSEDARNSIQTRICRLYASIQEAFEDWPSCPFNTEMTTLARHEDGDVLEAITKARIRHLAVVDTPAFAEAKIGIVAAMVTAPLTNPFEDPAFGKDGNADTRLARQEAERPGESVSWGAPLTITEDGVVFGHACLWGRCHAGFRDRCVVPPRDGDYSRFLHGEAKPGVRTGPLTVGTTHASLAVSATEAMDHYSHTGRAVADVSVGEDRHGLWVTGLLRPGISDRDLADLRGSSLSGDWRPVNGRYRLCGLLAVNQPGYLVQRSSATGVITAGPCSCDDADPLALLAERVAQLEEWRSSFVAGELLTLDA